MTRGEKQYINMPLLAARLYDNLTSVKGVNKGFEEIASFITNNLKHGRILDIGTGPGRLLSEINKKNPEIELYGLDISESMLAIAGKNLQNIKKVELKVGNITKTEYLDGYFDCIVSSGSFYNWDHSITGLNEIFRILKPGSNAYIFETYSDHNRELLHPRLKENLKGYNFVRRKLSVHFLKKQLRMTYAFKEFEEISGQSDFKNSYTIDQVELGNLPIYVRLTLKKN